MLDLCEGTATNLLRNFSFLCPSFSSAKYKLSELAPVDVLHVKVVVEVLGQGGAVAQTLQDGVHVARVAEVAQASQRCTQPSKRGVQVADFGRRGSSDLHFRVDFSRRRSGWQENTRKMRKKLHIYKATECILRTQHPKISSVSLRWRTECCK